MEKKLLMLHDALGASSQFAALSDLLIDEFEIHLLDFEGHGKSPMRDRPFRIQHFAENVVEFLNRGKIGPIDVFGYSMGGFVALTLATTHAELVNRIFTIATKFQWDEEMAWRESKLLDASKMVEKIPHFASQLE